MKQKNITIDYLECTTVELDAEHIALIQKAIGAAEKAYAPYSNFRVGAAVLLENGEIMAAGNQENAAYPSGMCAERTALYYCKALFPEVKIKTLAILALDRNNNILQEPVPPCGACRQVISETIERNRGSFTLLLHGSEKSYIYSDAGSLLPLSFGPSHL